MGRLFKTVVKHWTAVASLFLCQWIFTAWCAASLFESSNTLKNIRFSFFINLPKMIFFLSLSTRVQPCSPAFRAGQERALVWRICYWSALPWEWCHYDWDGQLWSDWWQDLRCWPLSDGECQLLPPRRLQDHITKVKRGRGDLISET